MDNIYFRGESNSKLRGGDHALRLGHRYAQHHALLFEGDDEQVEPVTGDFLRLDVDHLAHAVGRVNDEITLLKGEFLRLGDCLLRRLALPAQTGTVPAPAGRCC